MGYQDDETLLLRLKRGEEQAFADIYEKYCHFMTAEAVHMLRNASAAPDLVQDFFRACWENKTLHKLAMGDKWHLKTYLARAIRNNCCKYNLQNKMVTPIVEAHTELINTNNVESEIDTEQQQYIKKLIDELPPMPKTCVTEVYLMELDRKELLDRLCITSKTLRNHLHRGISELRHLLRNPIQS